MHYWRGSLDILFGVFFRLFYKITHNYFVNLDESSLPTVARLVLNALSYMWPGFGYYGKMPTEITMSDGISNRGRLK